MKKIYYLLLLICVAGDCISQTLSNTPTTITLTNSCLDQATGTNYQLIIHWNDPNNGPTDDMTFTNVTVTRSGSVTTIDVPGANFPTTAVDGWELAETDGVMIRLLPKTGALNVIYYNFGQTTCVALPITLKSFTARVNSNKRVQLTWVTEQEHNSSHFVVERNSWDTDGPVGGAIDMAIGNVQAAGESNHQITYTFTEPYAIKGHNFYRLKMVDIDGSYTHSTVAMVNTTNIDIIEPPQIDCSNITLDGPMLLCSGTATYTLSAVPGYSKLHWNLYPGVANVTFNGTSVTVEQTGNGMMDISVWNERCTYNTWDERRIVEVGKVAQGYYSPTNSWQPRTLIPETQGTNFVNVGENEVEISYPYYWNAVPTWNLVSGSVTSWYHSPLITKMYVVFPSWSWAMFEMQIETTCGTLTEYYAFESGSSYGYYRVSPSPASSQVTVFVDEQKLEKAGIEKSADQSIQQVVVVDRSGRIVLQQKFSPNTRKATLNISPLQKDIYIVRIFNGKEWTPVKFIKQ